MNFIRNLSKRAIAFLVVIMVVLSSITVSIAVIAANSIDVWDGTIATDYAGGTGIETDPFQIANGAQLAKFTMTSRSASAYAVLTNDIYLNDCTKANWKSTAKQWVQDKENYFKGNLNGNGYTIYGLYINANTTRAGFVAMSGQASFKNLTFSECSLTTTSSYPGLIVGRADPNASTSIDFNNIIVDETCEALSTYGDSSGQGIGAFVGISSGNLNFENCAVLGTVCNSVSGEHSAFVANVWNGGQINIKSSFVAAPIKFVYKYSSGCSIFISKSYGTQVEDGVTVLTPEQMQGVAAKENMPDLAWDTVWFISSGYPSLKYVEVITEEIWDGTVAEEYAGGTGTKDDPFQIANGAQLAKFTTTSRSSSAYAILTKDIYLNDYTKENWKSTAKQWVQDKDNYFKGHLDGDGHTIYGLYINANTTRAGLVAMSGEASFKNLLFSRCSLNTTSSYPGIIVGRADPAGSASISFSKVIVDSTCEALSTYGDSGGQGIAAFVGISSGNLNFENCAVLGTVCNSVSGQHSAFIANLWNGAQVNITGSFCAAPIKFVYKFDGTVNISNSYGTQAEDGVTVVNAEQMKGAAAKTNMPNLDWITTFAVDSKGGYPTLSFVDGFEGYDGQVWSGLIATKFSGGKGTENSPFLISNGEQLAFAVSTGAGEGKYYKLIADIKLNDTSKPNWKETAQNWLALSERFSGHLDGDGHTIDGLFYNGTANCVGLFRITNDISVKNLKFTNASLTTTGYGPSVVIAFPLKVTLISKVYVDETCEVKSTYSSTNDKGAGGFVGYGCTNLTIENSAFLGKVEAPAKVGAFVGNYWSVSPIITGSFSSFNGKLSGSQGLANSSANNYSAGTAEENGVTNITADKMLGAAAKANMPNLDWKYTWQLGAEGKYPTINTEGYNGIEGEAWEGVVANKYAGGTGTKDDPYLINTAEMLAKLVRDSATAGKYYKLTADIIINDTTKENWKETAKQWYAYNESKEYTDFYFQGTLDGNGKTITGLYINDSKVYVGLFAAIKGGAVIKNLIISDSHLESSYTGDYGGVSAFTGNVTGAVKFEKCLLTETVTIKGVRAAGFACYGGAGNGVVEIDTCASYANIEGTALTGAFFCDIWSATLKINNSIGLIKFSPKRSFSGGNNYGLVADDYGTNVLTLEQMKGDAAKKNMTLLNWDRSWKVTEGLPMLEIGEYEGKPGQAWSGKIASKFAGGTGTKEDPYLISTPEQLAKLVANITETNGEYYKLTHDIYLNNVKDKNWEKNAKQWFWVSTGRLGGFNGHFDGDGHVVYGMYLNIKQTASVVYTGLFPTLFDNSSVEKVGISEAKITIVNDNTSWENYVGGITSMVVFHKSAAETDPSELPVISQCFVDKKTVINAKYAGGLVGGGSYVPNMYNCYSVANVIGERVAAIIGNTWTEYAGATIENCYSATDNADLLVGGRSSVENSASPINFKNNYSNGNGLTAFVSKIGLLMMRGNAANKFMTTLDFDKIWYAVPNGTPVLRIFGKTDKFSNTTTPDPIKVSFVTNGGSACEDIFGNPEEPMTLPTTTREGFKFAGWYVYKELDVLYPNDTFPYFDTILYAKWTENGIIEDFEDYPDSIYDYGDDYEYFKPGTAGYNAKYVKSGMAVMHRKGLKSEEQDFLLNYEEMLEIGKSYKLSFWVTTDKENTKATLSLVHEEFPDVFDNDLGVQEIKVLEGMKDGEWQEVEVTFTAKTKWVAIRTSGDASLFFDDVMIIPTDEQVDVPSTNNNDNGTDFNIVPIIIIAAVVVLLLIAGVVVAIIIVKKKKA
ncbi:MAG: InlB B-repeat-containing protein [Clostridia bacterium]|nr:InlB B-repeat-containing protein [Clostridia bacterium]